MMVRVMLMAMVMAMVMVMIMHAAWQPALVALMITSG